MATTHTTPRSIQSAYDRFSRAERRAREAAEALEAEREHWLSAIRAGLTSSNAEQRLAASRVARFYGVST